VEFYNGGVKVFLESSKTHLSDGRKKYDDFVRLDKTLEIYRRTDRRTEMVQGQLYRKQIACQHFGDEDLTGALHVL